MKTKLPKQVTVARQEAAPPFRPAILSLVPSDNPHGDAIAHIPMYDGCTITEREEKIAEEIARRWNGFEQPVLEEVRFAFMLLCNATKTVKVSDKHEAREALKRAIDALEGGAK